MMIINQCKFLVFIINFIVTLSCGAHLQSSLQTNNKLEHLVLSRLNKFSNIIARRARSDSYCHNGGRLAANEHCDCNPPYTGPRCDDYACVHGISVGARYDSESLFFNKPCLCDEGWIGDLCEVPIANQCNDRGEFKNGRCHCIGYFFGSQCQYVSRCEHGRRKHGRCICEDGWEGDYCHEIICQHGYPDAQNGSQSCVCPIRFSGIHCDRCAQNAPKVEPYPDCTIHLPAPRARILRQKTNSQIRSRIVITVSACLLLLLLILTMFILHRRRQKQMRKSTVEYAGRHELRERQNMLEKAVVSPEQIRNHERILRTIESKLKLAARSHIIVTNHHTL